MTLKQYTVDAHFRVPYTTTVLATSAEEAEEKAEEQAKKFSEILSQYLSLKELYEHKDSEGWSMTVDLLNLKVDSTHPRTVYGRPFIPDFDD